MNMDRTFKERQSREEEKQDSAANSPIPDNAMEEKTESAKNRHSLDKTGIYRLCDARTGDHYLKVQISRNGRIFQKRFAERRWGGEEGAAKAAQAWRDMIITRHAAISQAEFCSILRSNNTSGKTGVSYAVNEHLCADGTVSIYESWVAHAPQPDGTIRTRKFSVNKYGFDIAWRFANQVREWGITSVEDIAFRENQQPIPDSTPEDFEALQARLREPEERREQKEAKWQAQADKRVARHERRQAQALAAEQKALKVKTSSGEPYISRYKNGLGSGGGWRVSIERLGKRYKKGFADATNGGSSCALEAAKAWRDETFRSLPVMSKAEVMTRVPPTNTSGVAGVFRRSDMVKEKQMDFWVAQCPKQPGKPVRRKSFTVAKYGEQQAFELAVKAREAFVAEFAEVPHLPKHAARQMIQRSGPSITDAPEPERGDERQDQMRRPHEILDFVKSRLNLNSDAALGRALGIAPPTLSNLRSGKLILGASHLIRLHEVSGLSVRELKGIDVLAGIPEAQTGTRVAGEDTENWKQGTSVESTSALNPDKVLDAAIHALGLKSDRSLSRALGVPANVISKLRNQRVPLGPAMILRIHEATGIPTRELKNM